MKHPQRRKIKKRASSKHTVKFLLDRGTVKDIINAKQKTLELLKYEWNIYSALAHQRNDCQEEIKKILTQSSTSNYEFKYWQRAVKYKYGLHPLSTAGSVSNIGGRFNTGSEVNSQVPFFPALYLANDKDTALQEHLGQQPTPLNSKLTPRDLALTSPASETIVSVSGHLDKIFDLTKADNLRLLTQLIRKFTLPKELLELSKKFHPGQSRIITNSTILHKSILAQEWRVMPEQYDVPATSQIFGHLVYSAGIEGILYPSKFTKKPCLAIFPRNFPDTESYLALDDEPPHVKVPKRIDTTSWRLCELNAKEILD